MREKLRKGLRSRAMPSLRWRHVTEWRFLFLVIFLFLWSTTLLGPYRPRTPREQSWASPDDGTGECEEHRIGRLLVVMRTRTGARRVRDVIRKRVHSQPHCQMDLLFLFGQRNSTGSQNLTEEARRMRDIVHVPGVADAHGRDALLALHFIKLLSRRKCKVYRQVAFGDFRHDEDRLLNKPRDMAERAQANFWELDSCLRFAHIRDNNPLFYAHYFPRRLHLQLETQLSFSYNEKVITPHDYQYLLGNPAKICRKSDKKEYFAIIAVHSSVHSFDNRILIRESWGHRKALEEYGMKLVFFVGKNSTSSSEETIKLQEESDTFGDLVQEDFEEAYKNMTLKQVGLLKFFAMHCQHLNYRYLLKADDDVVFDIPNSLQLLTSMLKSFPTPPRRSVFCYHLNEIATVPRYVGKWFVAPGEFPSKVYPAYCSGAGYYLTKDLVPVLYNASLHVRTFWVDDTYITGVLPNVIGDVTLFQLPRQFNPLALGALERAGTVDMFPNMYFFHTAQNAYLFKNLWKVVKRRRAAR